MKRFIQSNLRRFGLEAKRVGFSRLEFRRIGFSSTVPGFIADRKIDVVFDVGGNVGQFGESLRTKGYRGKIVSFEPIASVYQVLAAKAAADGNWETNNFALGAKTERTSINIAEASVFSSILPSAIAAVQFNDTAVVTHTETIEVRRLDDVGSDWPGNVLLKIDTQGYEKQVLEGGRQVLSSMKGVLMELPIIHLYEGTWRLHQAIEYMADAGFVPAQIHPVSYHSADEGALVEVDCLFRPRDGRLD